MELIDKNTLNLTQSEIHWRYFSDSISGYIKSEQPVFSTDVPMPYLIFVNEFTGKAFAFNGLNNHYIEDDKIMIFEKSNHLQNSLYGWFRKNKDGKFCELGTGKYLEYENDKLYSVNGQLMTVCQPITEIAEYRTPENLNFRSLYKFDTLANSLKIVSGNAKDIFEVTQGLFYIPYPGTGVIKIIDIKDVSKRLLTEAEKNIIII